MTNDQMPPAGWYPDKSANAPAGQQRYWDGSAWTERTTAPATQPTTVQPAVAEPAVAEPARKSSILARWGIPALVGVVAFLFGIGVGGAGDGGTAEPTPAPTVTVDPSAAREAELDKIAADLDEIAAGQATVNEELAAKEAELAAREEAVGVVEAEAAANTITDGIWTVGVDIAPGTYRSDGATAECYWAITVTGSNGADIIENDLPGGGRPQVALEEGHDFTIARCGTWTLD
jgi:Protein of unknown function (DUF2510)